ncbi:MAG: hypothetical protein COV59_00740 [Candidatus Magasanikbacteria bacterium CG11_big_fil_rev_8_21_14_0_20_39_34]|uniref:Uncharacterized protein n=1 Tax=Candidatus Magasanikbacteria bacterium CG11_big_fil_rev_8_21_14_0_20_39_34 TaxID=1974653 RepID=A0A2H0N6F8_9BACT|nr:MAG: hypothetical protein COV59_00740 [Candidatus Magasanikbacteria bacterium CG11_big_fil_rev_8_21_14_0_20_39_34]
MTPETRGFNPNDVEMPKEDWAMAAKEAEGREAAKTEPSHEDLDATLDASFQKTFDQPDPVGLEHPTEENPNPEIPELEEAA